MSWEFAVLITVGYAIATYLMFRTFQDIAWRSRMKKREAELKASGIVPGGSALSHGIRIHKKTGSIESDEKPSLIWYKRLLY